MRAWFGLLVVTLLACGEQVESPQLPALASSLPVAATVNGEPIVVDNVRTDVRTEEGRRGWVRAEIARRLGAEEAVRRGLLNEPRVQRRVATIRQNALRREASYLREVLFEAVADDLALAEADLREHYEASRGRYFERQLEFRRATFGSRQDAEAADAELGPDGRLGESAEQIGPAAIEDLPRDILPDALTLRAPGDRVLVQAGGSWALVELVETLEAVPRPFEEVRASVVQSLRTIRSQEAFQALQESLFEGAEVVFDDSVIGDDSVWEEARSQRDRRRAER